MVVFPNEICIFFETLKELIEILKKTEKKNLFPSETFIS